jgi:NADH:ubiquinone oxidoreductase subunit 2 (subunit N)
MLRVAFTHPEGEVEKVKLPVLVTVVLVLCVIGIIVTGVVVAPLLNWAGLAAGANPNNNIQQGCWDSQSLSCRLG